MDELLDKAALDGWYHTIDLGKGRVTEGIFDLRRYVDAYGLPDRMDGLRALDVGTQDGFWAFEMERRGADVVALNHPTGAQDLPPRARNVVPAGVRPAAPRPFGQDGNFHLAKAILGSKVACVSCDIRNAHPEDLGTFDLVFAGSILIHVRDPVLALERMANLCRGTFVSCEPYDRLTGLLPFPVARYRGHTMERFKREAGYTTWHGWFFWKPNLKAWRQMIWSAGFDAVEQHSRFTAQASAGFKIRQVVHHAHCG